MPFNVVIQATEDLAICGAKEVPSFLIYFKTLSTGLVPGIEPKPPVLYSSALLTELILLKLCNHLNHAYCVLCGNCIDLYWTGERK